MKQEEFENEKVQIDELIEKDEVKTTSEEVHDNYKFGWSIYSELTNGRFAMLGFIAIILIEILSQQSFLKWAGIQ